MLALEIARFTSCIVDTLLGVAQATKAKLGAATENSTLLVDGEDLTLKVSKKQIFDQLSFSVFS